MRPPPSPKTKALARQVLAFEAAVNEGPAVFHACEKLRLHLGTLAGVAGFRTLLHRALALARADNRALNHLVIRPDGSLAWDEELKIEPAQRQIYEEGTALVAQLLALLEIFIGEALMLHLLQDVWPMMDPNQKFEKT